MSGKRYRVVFKIFEEVLTDQKLPENYGWSDRKNKSRFRDRRKETSTTSSKTYLEYTIWYH